jgi:hypothetical protein
MLLKLQDVSLLLLLQSGPLGSTPPHESTRQGKDDHKE